MSNKKILIVSGSLRLNSSSNKLIPEITRHFDVGYEFEISSAPGKLPHFNDAEEACLEVLAWRRSIIDADGVLFITPEYAFGVPGNLKNALDWIVSSGELVNKPTALITASTGGEHAHRSLLLTLEALTAKPAPGCDLLISFIRSKIDGNGRLNDAEALMKMRTLVKFV